MREAGKTFALPTYLFSVSAGLVVTVGVAARSSATSPKITYGQRDQRGEDVPGSACATRNTPCITPAGTSTARA